jgi:hypothetical protein
MPHSDTRKTMPAMTDNTWLINARKRIAAEVIRAI